MKSLAKNKTHLSLSPPGQKAAMQPRLLVNTPGDRYEREADAMAGRVMQLQEVNPEIIPATSGLIARSIQRQADPGATGGYMASPGLVSQLGRTAGEGSPLPLETRFFMENAFSTDFSGVRIHTGSQAAAMSQSIRAEAFTYGEDIFFNEGEFHPESDEGKALLAHELTHVVQQQGAFAGAGIQRRAIGTPPPTQEASSPLGIAQLLIDRLNRQSTAIQYRFYENRIEYLVADEAALSTFDWQMRGLIDLGDIFLLRLVDLVALGSLPESAPSPGGFTDMAGLLANSDENFQGLLLQFFGASADTAPAPEAVAAPPAAPTLDEVPSEVPDAAIQPEALVGPEPESVTAAVATETEAAPTEETTPAAAAAPLEEGAVAATPLLSPEPLMPEPSGELSAETQQRIDQVQTEARRSSARSASLPSDTEITADARAGVTEPDEETQAVASGSLTDTLNQRPEPSPEIEELCANIQRAIRARRPPDEDSLLSADPEAAANEVGTALNENISSDADRVGEEYNSLDNPPAGTPAQIGEEPELPPNEFNTGQIDAAQAAPDPVPAEDVSLDNDVENTDSAMAQAGMSTPVTDEITDPANPIVMAREAHGELEETAAQDPALVLAQQDEAIATAQAGMEDLQARALQALQASRSGTIGGTDRQQTALIGTEEQKRAEVGRRAEAIFTTAQTQVNDLLQPLTRTAMEMWTTGKDRISTEFRQHLADVQRWVDERHSGVGGAFLSVVDYVSGLPDWVTDEYNDAEQTFSDDICDKIREISTYVNGIIMTCEEIIETADQNITQVFEDARGELGDWVDQERAGFAGRLEGLRNQVHETRDNFNRDLANQAAQTVQAVREEIHALRQAARGLVGRIADAIAEFVDDPIRFIINGLLSLVGIEPVRFWALANRIAEVISDIANDPLGFASNLLSAIGDGFSRFFDNFGTHLLNGLLGWLFSGLGAVGVQVPTDFSLSSVITFFLQLMGITWERVRMLLARHIGEENVELIERAFEVVSNLIQMGPAGIFELLKDMLDPQNILNTILQMAIDFMIERIITQATIRIIGLFNPVGAVVQAIMAIYDVLSWIFNNAARIFTLIETVVNGIANIIAGNTAAMALAVEQALAGLLIPVIDFIAEFLSLGGLPERIADAVRGLQQWVEGLLDRVIRWLAEQARALLRTLGFGGDEEEGGDAESDQLDDTEVGESINFSADGEAHRLWIATEGAGVEVMVRSTPVSVEHKLAEWDGRVGTLPDETQSEARGLLSTAHGQYQTVKQEGAQAEQEIEQAGQNPESQEVDQAEQADQEVESAERALKNTLVRLFEVFGGAATAAIIARFRSEIDQLHPEVSVQILSAFEHDPEKYQNIQDWGQIQASLERDVIREEHRRPINLGHRYGQFVNDNQAKPALDAAISQSNKTEQEALHGDTKDDFINARRGAIHNESSSGTPRQVLTTLRNQIFNNTISGLAISNLTAFYLNSISGHSDHDRFRPVDIRPSITADGGKRIMYIYAEGQQQFEVLLNKDNYPTRIVGENLNLHDLGRGVTQEAIGRVSGAQQDSAHLIANMFSGTGYNARIYGIKVSLNLVATSDRFNRVTMLSREREIRSFVLSFNNGLDVESFRLEVEVTWASENDSIEITKIQDEIRRLADDDQRRSLLEGGEQELRQLIQSNLARTSQPRVMNVKYYVSVQLANGEDEELSPPPQTGPELLFGLT